MIDIQTRLHDRLSIEFKVGFVTRRKLKKNDFNLAMWIFVPESLDINSSTYTKADFYRSVKSNVRLITPRVLLRDIAGGPAQPLRQLEKASSALAAHPSRVNVAEFEYQAKLFSAIVKSALRDESGHIAGIAVEADILKLCGNFEGSVKSILSALDSIRAIVDVPAVPSQQRQCFEYCCEFICNIAAQYSFKLYKGIQARGLSEGRNLMDTLSGLFAHITEYGRSRGYALLSGSDKEANSHYVYRHGLIKKFVERQLYLKVPKKRDGILAEQAYYSIAAGLAMIFATIVAWAFQKSFGNLTWPLFIALIISYMLKDRIKELMRYYFSHKIGGKYFDNKAKMSHKGSELGWMKEAMDFVPVSGVPEEILALRHDKPLSKIEARAANDNVILYRKSVHIDRETLEAGSQYEFPGVNDIIRFQVGDFLHMMDDPQSAMGTMDRDGKPVVTMCEKHYFISIVLQYEHADEMDFKHFRICLTRDGIKGIEEL